MSDYSASFLGKARVALAERWLDSYYGLRGLFYRGDRFYCPCCENTSGQFLSYKGQSNRLCPWCRSFERHRLMWLYLKRETDLFTGRKNVLHVAPHYIIQKRIRRLPHVETYISVDVNSLLAMEKVNIEQMPFPSQYFDLLICSHVLEHVEDDRRAMQELRRVLRKGGWAYLPVPIENDRARTYEDPTITSEEERRAIFGQSDHIRIYGRDYCKRLKDAGFRVTSDLFVQKLSPSLIQKARLDRTETIYVAHRD